MMHHAREHKQAVCVCGFLLGFITLVRAYVAGESFASFVGARIRNASNGI